MISKDIIYHPLVISKDFCWMDNAAGRVDRDFWKCASQKYFAPKLFCSNWEAEKDDVLALINPDSKDQISVSILNEIKGARIIKSLFNRFPIPDFRYLPDMSYITWGRFVKKHIVEYIRNNHVDYIDSLGMPHSSHLLALYLKKECGLPWVARFYDPWIDNQQVSFVFEKYRKAFISMEKEVAEKADVIIHNNTHIAQVWSDRYGPSVANKIQVLPMVFDSKRPFGYMPKPHTEGYLIISHIGNLYGVRNAHYLIHSIKKLISQNPSLATKIKVNMVGWVPAKDVEEIDRLGLNDIFYLPGRLREADCTTYFNESDLFISIDGEGEKDLNYPSKLLKYFYFRKPILGLTLHNSVAAEELERSGNYHVDESDIDAIAAFLEKAFFEYESLLNFDENYYLRFSPESVIKSYKTIIDKILV